MTVTNTTISGNTAGNIGGIFVAWNAHLVAVNSTITHNEGYDNGGTFVNDANSLLTLQNTIVAGNISTAWGGYNRDIGAWQGAYDASSSNNLIGDNAWNRLD